jgi:hypothetical protein
MMISHLSKALGKYLNSPELSDVSFIIQKQKFYAHKLILSARSPYFANLITHHCKDNSSLEIEIEDATPNIFYSILEFMYTDAARLTTQTFWELYKAGKFYQLNDLIQVAHVFIANTMDTKNVFDIWKTAQINGSVPISEICIHFTLQAWKNELGTRPLSPYDNVGEIEKLCLSETYILSNGTPNTPSDRPNSNGMGSWDAFPTAESLATFPNFFKVPSDPNIEKRDKRFSVITDSTSVVGSVIQYVLTCTTKLMKSTKTSLFLYDKDTNELYSQVASVNEVVRIQSGDHGIVGTTFKSGKTQVENSNGKTGFGEDLIHVICSPVVRKEKVIGVLEVLNKNHPFEKLDESNLRTISELVGFLLEEIRTKNSLDHVMDDDFNISDLLEKRNSSSEFKLPNEDVGDTYQTFMRGYPETSPTGMFSPATLNPHGPLTIVPGQNPTEPLTFISEEFDEKPKKKKKVDPSVPFMHFRIPR